MEGSADEAQIFRTFWHGRPLGPYQILCLRSFVARGYRIELFSYDDQLAVPDWIVRKDAQQLLPADRILQYRSGWGRGSPALHANLFRYALLYRLGGWWIDTDVVLLRSELPAAPIFFAAERDFSTGTEVDTPFGNAIMRFPRQHPLLAEAIERCLAVGESARWGQTGPTLLTELINKYELTPYANPPCAAYPVRWRDFAAFFDPARCDETRSRCKDSTFVHLWNEMWRHSRVPDVLGPPAGSFLDWLTSRLDIDLKFGSRMQFLMPAATRPRPY
jgi:hypothetical protein